MTDNELPDMMTDESECCEAAGCDSTDTRAFLSMCLPGGDHAVILPPLSERQLRKIIATGTFEVAVPEGAEAAAITFLCHEHSATRPHRTARSQ